MMLHYGQKTMVYSQKKLIFLTRPYLFTLEKSDSLPGIVWITVHFGWFLNWQH